jgi:hypothetical protein
MKKILINFFVLFSFITTSLAQCVNLTINEHIGGDPICNLYSGATLEVCYEDKTVTAGSCGTLYIKSVSGSSTQTFQLALDNVYWAPTYAELQINTNTKRLGFVVGGSYGAYSYYNPADIEKQRANEEAERIKQEALKQEENRRKLERDQIDYKVLNQLVSEKKYLEAENKLKTLFFPNSYEKTALIHEQVKLIQLAEEEKKRVEQEKQNSIAQSYISALISEKHFYQASQYYSLNSLKYDLNKFYIPIKNGLADSLSKDTLTLNNSIVNQFIIKNKARLCNLGSGAYTFNINTQGYHSGNYDLITDVPYKTFGITNVENLKVGDRYLGGVIIKINDNDILLSSPRPIGSGPFDSAIELCSKYQLGGLVWRMPNPEELNSVFDLANKLEYYENNWYWTSVTSDQSAQHLGNQRRDMAFVPKKDGKWVFAVSTVSYFKVPLNSKMNIIINEVKDSLIKIEYTSSSDKPIYNKDNTAFFYKSKNSLPICQYSQDQSLPKNLIRLKRHMESYKQANGVLLKGEHNVITTDYLIKKKE